MKWWTQTPAFEMIQEPMSNHTDTTRCCTDCDLSASSTVLLLTVLLHVPARRPPAAVCVGAVWEASVTQSQPRYLLTCWVQSLQPAETQ